MFKHIIKFEDVKNYTVETELAGHYNSKVSKSLKAYTTFGTGEIVYKIFDNRELVAEEYDLEMAVRKYNEL